MSSWLTITAVAGSDSLSAIRCDPARRHSGNGSYGISTPSPPQSALMPVNLTTLPHFAVSSAISLPKSAGEPASTVPPRSANRAFILGSARAALIFLLSVSTISAGVFFGNADAIPLARFVARQELTHGRDAGQHFRARGGGYRERAQRASPDIPYR